MSLEGDLGQVTEAKCLPCQEAWVFPVGSGKTLMGFTQNNEQVIFMFKRHYSGSCVNDRLEGGREINQGTIRKVQTCNGSDLKVVIEVEKRKWIEGIFRRLNQQDALVKVGVESERRKNQGRPPGFQSGGQGINTRDETRLGRRMRCDFGMLNLRFLWDEQF